MRPHEVAVRRELLECIDDWLRSNPPSNGWGQLDRVADNERKDLISKIRSVLDGPDLETSQTE